MGQTTRNLNMVAHLPTLLRIAGPSFSLRERSSKAPMFHLSRREREGPAAERLGG